MFLLHLALTYLAFIYVARTGAASDYLLNNQHVKFFAKRQGDLYQATTTKCGIVATCEAASGLGYVLCGSRAHFLIYNPSAKDMCCVSGADHACKSLHAVLSGAGAKVMNLLPQDLARYQASASSTAIAAPMRRPGDLSLGKWIVAPSQFLEQQIDLV